MFERAQSTKSSASLSGLANSRAAKFASATSIALHFPHNESEGDDEETTRVYYIGLRGSWKPVSRAEKSNARLTKVAEQA